MNTSLKNISIFSLILLSLAFLATCGPSTSPPPPKPNVDTHAMRGIIRAAPTPAMPHQLSIQHESTPDMASMTMPFTVDTSVSLTDFAAGDKIAFTFQIDKETHKELITKIEKLPPDTVLNLGMPTSTPAK
ncbi:MAG TPA: copper-binding protein [Phycisphaerae bacterium]|jgi:Cu/Ag efflux protein CusF